MALDDLAAHAEDDALDARLLGLFGDRLQRFLQRQPGAQQRRELTRQHRQIAASRGRAGETARAPPLFSFALRRLLNIHRQQLLVAQQLPDVLRRIAFDETLAFRVLERRAPCIRMHPSGACL